MKSQFSKDLMLQNNAVPLNRYIFTSSALPQIKSLSFNTRCIMDADLVKRYSRSFDVLTFECRFKQQQLAKRIIVIWLLHLHL